MPTLINPRNASVAVLIDMENLFDKAMAICSSLTRYLKPTAVFPNAIHALFNPLPMLPIAPIIPPKTLIAPIAIILNSDAFSIND